MTATPSGHAQTVLGPIPGEAMGITLPHEHLLIDFTVMFAEPEDPGQRARAREPVGLANLGWIRYQYNANLDNLRLDDEATAADEAGLFGRAGGQTIVDPTNRSLARNPEALARLARATGLHVVMGSGYYVAAAHPPDMGRRKVTFLWDGMPNRRDHARAWRFTFRGTRVPGAPDVTVYISPTGKLLQAYPADLPDRIKAFHDTGY